MPAPAVIRPAEARRNVSIMINSSMMLSLVGMQVDWIFGSSGVDFLRRALDLTFFPELYEVRSRIGQ